MSVVYAVRSMGTHTPCRAVIKIGTGGRSFLAHPRAFFTHLSSPFRRPHPNNQDASQQVAATRNKKPLFVAPPRNKQNKMQGAERQGQEASPRPPPSAAAVTSTASAVAALTNATGTTTTPIAATGKPCHPTAIVSNRRAWWVHVVLFICCPSDHH
ncbi:hypothetical protein M405DRAFT_829197 [Rhizopogon salebrosus TDB-379]|nr:hypothetical protein M405DRAFT_829197 [Rhizopogon salebrosus TDB-379]